LRARATLANATALALDAPFANSTLENPHGGPRLLGVLQREGFQPRLPVPLAELGDAEKRGSWIRDRNLIAFTLVHPTRTMEELDIVLVMPFPWSEVATSRVWSEVEGVRVPVMGRRLLRRMKLSTGREKDRVDAELLGESDD
jgi:hypothetical protein